VILIIYLQTLNARPVSHLIPLLIHPKDPEQIHCFAGHNQPIIIIISSSPTALITMHNVDVSSKILRTVSITPVFFFSHPKYSFEPSQEARARTTAEGNLKPDLIAIYRKRIAIDSSGKETVTRLTYFVVDSVEALSKFGTDAWERVACVMTTGQAWQFRPYKWNEPRQLFHNGVYSFCFAVPWCVSFCREVRLI
jgi:parafibromin